MKALQGIEEVGESQKVSHGEKFCFIGFSFSFPRWNLTCDASFWVSKLLLARPAHTTKRDSQPYPYKFPPPYLLSILWHWCLNHIHWHNNFYPLNKLICPVPSVLINNELLSGPNVLFSVPRIDIPKFGIPSSLVNTSVLALSLSVIGKSLIRQMRN